MNNINFIKYLQNLTDDRFTLTYLDHNEYRTFHALLLATFTDSDSQQIIHSSNPTADWYLLGTDGCHLCHASHALLTQVRVIYPHMPTVHVLELTGSDELIDHLGMLIPIHPHLPAVLSVWCHGCHSSFAKSSPQTHQINRHIFIFISFLNHKKQ